MCGFQNRLFRIRNGRQITRAGCQNTEIVFLTVDREQGCGGQTTKGKGSLTQTGVFSCLGASCETVQLATIDIGRLIGPHTPTPPHPQPCKGFHPGGIDGKLPSGPGPDIRWTTTPRTVDSGALLFRKLHQGSSLPCIFGETCRKKSGIFIIILQLQLTFQVPWPEYVYVSPFPQLSATRGIA